MATDWGATRANRFTNDRPAEWLEGVYGISLTGLNLLGIHEKSGKLYWDGKEIVTRSLVRLGTFERWIAVIATGCAFGTFIVNAGRALGYWH
jgi:hypothetical protein